MKCPKCESEDISVTNKVMCALALILLGIISPLVLSIMGVKGPYLQFLFWGGIIAGIVGFFYAAATSVHGAYCKKCGHKWDF